MRGFNVAAPSPASVVCLVALAAYAPLGAGCAVMDGVGFGLDVANADTTLSFRHNDGKSVVAAEQNGNRINFNLRR
jgi:hypothetical protein